jgi:hypothetical protein
MSQSVPRQGRDGAVYVRQQKGVSFTKWVLILGIFTLWIPAIYFAVSPNYFWKA